MLFFRGLKAAATPKSKNNNRSRFPAGMTNQKSKNKSTYRIGGGVQTTAIRAAVQCPIGVTFRQRKQTALALSARAVC